MNTRRLAELAQLSYDECTHEDIGMDAQALVTKEAGATIVAFRGTENLADAITDLRIAPWYDRQIGAWCVSGFLKYTRPLIAQIYPEINHRHLLLPGPVFVTGHSLGGAAASIFAAFCKVKGVNVAGLVTFGEPRPGFSGLGKIVNSVPGYRFAIDGDPVDDVPPFSPLSPFFYCHGREVSTLPGRIGADHPMDGYLESVPKITLRV